MSNKDVRRPAEGAAEDFAKRQAGESAPVDPDLEFLESLTPEERQEWVEAGYEAKATLSRRYTISDEPLGDEGVASTLDVCTKFLLLFIRMSTDVLQTIDVGSVRSLVADELPLPGQMVKALKAAGYDLGEIHPKSVKQDDGRDHRKLPRGRKHPLIGLIQLVLQAVRLLDRITVKTHPAAHNKKEKGSGFFIPDLPDLPGPC